MKVELLTARSYGDIIDGLNEAAEGLFRIQMFSAAEEIRRQLTQIKVPTSRK
ncbi:MAG: hypothetical protein KDA68_06095 [Planctomycetaceae bacterium]|nr:hypothetical protein [Planctomycetaceae bacterium]